jgi:hypothetical protein
MYTLSRLGTPVRAMFTALVVLALCCEVCAQSFDGTWSGTTSQVGIGASDPNNIGKPKTISFTVVNMLLRLLQWSPFSQVAVALARLSILGSLSRRKA